VRACVRSTISRHGIPLHPIQPSPVQSSPLRVAASAPLSSAQPSPQQKVAAPAPCLLSPAPARWRSQPRLPSAQPSPAPGRRSQLRLPSAQLSPALASATASVSHSTSQHRYAKPRPRCDALATSGPLVASAAPGRLQMGHRPTEEPTICRPPSNWGGVTRPSAWPSSPDLYATHSMSEWPSVGPSE